MGSPVTHRIRTVVWVLVALASAAAAALTSAQGPFPALQVYAADGPVLQVAEVDTGLPDAEAGPGEQVVMRLTAQGVQTVAGLQFTLSFDPSVVQVAPNGLNEGATPADFLFLHRMDQGEGAISLMVAGATGIGTDSLAIADVIFDIIGDEGQSSSLTFVSATAGDDSIPPQRLEVDTQGGSIQVRTEDEPLPPTADANGPYQGEEGSAIFIDASGSSDPESDALSYSYDCTDDGSFEVADFPESAFGCTYIDNGEFTVRVQVKDDEGLTDEATATVIVNNVVPGVDVGVDNQTVRQGGTVALEANFSDSGIEDAPWQYLIDWGDDTMQTGDTGDQSLPILATHQYAVPGQRLVQVCITDKDGDTSCGSTQVEVAANQRPIADAGPDQTVAATEPAGAVATLDGTGSSDPDNDSLTYLWTAQDIIFDDPTSPMPFATFPVGTTTVTLLVNDGTEYSEPDTVDITVLEPTAVGCPDDVLISNYQTDPSNEQFVEVANVGGSNIDLNRCSLVTFNVFTETSIGDATAGLSGTLDPGETTRVNFEGALSSGPGAIGLYDSPPPPDGSPFTTDNEITGMVYLDNDTVFGIGHLTKPEHNDIYACIYGSSEPGPFTRPFQPLVECLP